MALFSNAYSRIQLLNHGGYKLDPVTCQYFSIGSKVASMVTYKKAPMDSHDHRPGPLVLSIPQSVWNQNVSCDVEIPIYGCLISSVDGVEGRVLFSIVNRLKGV